MGKAFPSGLLLRRAALPLLAGTPRNAPISAASRDRNLLAPHLPWRSARSSSLRPPTSFSLGRPPPAPRPRLDGFAGFSGSCAATDACGHRRRALGSYCPWRGRREGSAPLASLGPVFSSRPPSSSSSHKPAAAPRYRCARWGKQKKAVLHRVRERSPAEFCFAPPAGDFPRHRALWGMPPEAGSIQTVRAPASAVRASTTKWVSQREPSTFSLMTPGLPLLHAKRHLFSPKKMVFHCSSFLGGLGVCVTSVIRWGEASKVSGVGAGAARERPRESLGLATKGWSANGGELLTLFLR